MKILIVAYWHDPRFKKKAGGLIRMFELADNLIASGHDVAMALPKLGFPKTQTRARVIEIPFPDISVIRPLCFHVLSTLYLLFSCPGRIDRLYVRQMNSFLPFIIARLFGIFSYFEIPNDPFIGYSSLGRFKRRIVEFIDQRCMALSDRVIVLSEWSKNRIHTQGHIPQEKIMVFPSGTDTDLFAPREKNLACAELNLDPSCCYVGFIGSFFPHQGIDTLIEAAPSVLQKMPGTRFLMIGDGPMRAEWEEMIHEKKLQRYFIFTGHVPYRKVPVYLGAMDVCVAPHREGTNQASPVKLFDYMAAGRPIVASRIDVVQEIIADSECAVLVEPDHGQSLADAIVSLLGNPPWAKQMGERGRTYCLEHYDRKSLTQHLFSQTATNG